MPNWKKVIVSGSDAALNSLNVTSHFTASGLIYPTVDGTSGQVILTDGNGNLSFSNIGNTTISIKNVSGGTIQKGTPCYITGSGTAGNLAGVWPADASNPLRMPAGVIAGETLNNGDEGIGLINGFINGVNTSAFGAGDSVYVAVGGGYTNIRPTGSSILVQKLGNVEKSAINGSGVINGPAYYNDLPNIQSGYTWVGNNNGVAVAVTTSSIQNVVSSSFALTASFINATGSNAFVQGGNSFGTNALLGTNDNQPLAFETNGSTRMFISSSGNVGIGTTSPTYKLHVSGNSFIDATAASATLTLGRFSGESTIKANTDDGGWMIIDSNGTATSINHYTSNPIYLATGGGNVGIGTSSPTSRLHVAGTTRLTGSFNTAISGSILTVVGSGSAQPIFTVQGSQGELFSITDSLSGSLFSVNDISGLPILEVFSDNTTLIGNYQDPMLITTTKLVTTASGAFTLYSLPTASYDTAFFEYSIKSGSNARAGTIMAIQLGSSVNFTETTTTDFGSTSGFGLTVQVAGANMILTGSATTSGWTVKTIVRGI